MKVILANPRGFCAGVDRAITIVERVLASFGAPVYVRHEVVHNQFVVDRLKQQGAIFTDEIDSVPVGATLVFSAHGVSQAVRQQAASRQLTVFDATCPLVTKVHIEVVRAAKKAQSCVLIGHAGHPEVEGTMGQYDRQYGGDIHLVESLFDIAALSLAQPDNALVVTQTTLSVNDTAEMMTALRAKYPNIQSPKQSDICYATTNRQQAVSDLSAQCDVVVVIGSETSSNSTRLKELAERLGVRAYLVDGAEHLERAWFAQAQCVGVTAGASAPDVLVQGVVAQLQAWGAVSVEEQAGEAEHIVFALPKSLRSPSRDSLEVTKVEKIDSSDKGE